MAYLPKSPTSVRFYNRETENGKYPERKYRFTQSGSEFLDEDTMRDLLDVNRVHVRLVCKLIRIDAFLCALPDCPDLTSLDLTGNEITNNEAVLLAAALKQHCPKLESLNVSFNEIGNQGAAALASIPRLLLLNFVYNEIDDLRDIFHNLLLYSPLLQTIVLSANFIEDEFAFFVARFLPKFKELVEFDISDNLITDAGVNAFAAVLPKCERINSFRVSGNAVSREANRPFQEFRGWAFSGNWNRRTHLESGYDKPEENHANPLLTALLLGIQRLEKETNSDPSDPEVIEEALGRLLYSDFHRLGLHNVE